MLQPKKDNFKLNQADQSLLEKEMIAYAEEGATDDDLIEFKNTYIAEKKKATPKSDSTIQENNTESVQKDGSLDGVGSNGFPAIDVNLGVPGLKPDLKTVEQLANPPKIKQKEIKTPKDLRLANETDFKEMQKQGIAPPNSELRISERVSDTSDNYDLQGNLPTPKAKKVDSVTQTHWNEPFQPKNITATNKELPKDGQYRLPDDYSMKIKTTPEFTEDLYNFTEKDKAEIKKNIDTKIEDNDLDIEHPYLYFSSYDKPSISKDDFVTRTFGEEKLKEIGINIADFDGFLNKKGYKKEFLDKESKGMFEGSGYGKENYNIELAKDIQKNRLLNLYIGEINGRNLAKRKLEKEKSNLEKSSKQISEEGELTPYTLFDQEKLEQFVETEMPTLSKKLKEVDSENKEIYAKHKSGDANLLYGTEKTFKKIGYGFIDKVNQISATVFDKIGADEHAQGLRFLNEQRQISRPNTRDVGYAKGKTTKVGDTNYLVTDEGRIIDQDLKIDVTDLLKDYEVDSIKFSAKEENKSDYTFSPQGSIIQFGGVVGDMIVQLALTKSLSNVVPSLAQIPLSRGMSSAIITQSALGYTQGVSETYKQLIDAGVNEKDAKLIANEAGQNMALLYGVTAPLSPQTKATQAIFGKEGKQLIKEAVKAYTQSGKKGFLETLKSGLSKIPRHAVDWVEEGLIKEGTQELIQQGGESYGVNAEINRQAGQHIVKDTINANEVINTLIQTTLSGGLAVVPNLFTKTDKLKTLSDLSKDANFDSNLNNLVEKGVVTKEQANVLKKDVQVFSNQIGKIPKNLNKNIAMDVMTDLQEIQDLEAKKKTLDKSFHEDIDAEIETKRTLIKDRIKFDALSKKEITELKSTAKKELIQEAKDKDEDVSKIDNAQIVERANKIYSKQLKDAEAKTTTTETQPQAEVPIDNREKRKFNEAIDKLQSGEYGLDVAPGDKTAMIKKGAFSNIVEIELTKEEQKEIERQFRFNADGDLSNEELRQWRKDFEKRVAERYKLESQEAQAEVPQQAEAEKVELKESTTYAKGNKIGDNRVAFDLHINNTSIGDVSLAKEGDRYYVHAIEIGENSKGKGYAGETYKLIAKKLQDAGYKFNSAKESLMEPEAIRVWEKLVKSGDAIKNKDNSFSFIQNQEVSPVEDVVATSVEENKNDEIFYTGRGKKIDDFTSTKGEFIFFSKNKNVSEWYGGDETKVTEANIDTSNFIDLSTQEKKAEFVKENFTEKDIQDLFPEIINRFRFEGDKEKWIKEKLESLQEDRFSGDGELQKTLLKKIKEKGHSGVVLEDTFFGKKDISYVVVDKNVIKSKDAKTSPTNNPVNGNLSTRTSDVGESGITEQQSPAKESVQSANVVEGETKKINGKELTFYKLEGDNTDSGFAVEKNKDGYVIQSALLPFSKQKQGIGTDFYVRINNESIEKTGSPLKSSENLSNSGGKPFWEKLVDKGLAEKTEDGFKFKEQTKVTNETAPSQDSTIDGNVQSRTSNVGESRTTEQQSTEKESVPSTVDVGKDKGYAEIENIDEIANFLKDEFINPKQEEKVVEKPKATKEQVVEPVKETKLEQAKGFVSMAVKNLTTSLKDFQGRAKEYSEDTYNRIVNEAKEGVLNISSIPPIQIWKNPETGQFVILAGHSRTKAFSDLAEGKVEFADKYKKSDFEKVNTQIVEAETLEEAQKIAQESNQGSAQTVVDNAKYVRESLLSTFQNFNQAKTKLKSLYGPAWARIYAYANLNPKGKAMQMLKLFQDANESDSNDKSKKIAEWTGKTRADFDKLTDAHENEIFDFLSKNDKIKTYSELSELLNRRVNGLEEFNQNEPLNFEQKVGRGSNEVEIVKEIQDLKNRDVQIKKKIKELQSFGKNINDTQRKQVKDLTAESIKINTVDIPNAQVKQKQARVADAEQFDIFSQINEQIENGNITSEQVDEFVNDDRKAAEIEPIVEAIEFKAKSENKIELNEAVRQVNEQIEQNQVERKPTNRGNDGELQKYSGKPLAEQENKRPGIVVQAEFKMPTTKDFLSEAYEIDEVQKQGVNSALSLFENGGKSFLLADGTGVGKTRQILVTAKEYLNNFGGKVLIISENTTILTKNFANDAKALAIDMNEFEFGTYNDLRTGKKGKGDYGLVIYDEAHNLKNQESGKAIAAGNIKSKNNMYVTATPMDTIGSAVYFISEVSGVTEEQAYNMLGLNVKKQKDAVTGQEVKIVTLQEGVAPADIKRNIVKIREEIISKGAMLRREYPFYGEFVEDKISLTEEQVNEQDEIESNWDDRIEYESMTDDGMVNFRKKMNLSGQKSGELGRWSESTKIKYTFKEVVKAIKEGKKVVVIAEGVNETTITAIDKVVPGFLSELSKMLKAEGYKVVEIFGKSDKGDANDKFQANEVDVVLGTAKSASTGIDLDDQNGDSPRVLFMVTPNYSGNVFQQILGRVSRRNTKSPAQVRLLFNESNIDARRKQIVNGKLQTLKAIQEGVIDDEIEIDIQEAPIPSADVNINLESITLENISEKAFVIKGDTRPIKDNIKAIGGKYNPKYGWIFPISRKAEVQEMLNKLSEQKPAISESQQLKDNVNAEIDKIAQKVKDLLPGIDDPDLKKQGISQDDLIDLVANAVKALVSKGIDINDAIRQVIASIKERFNVDVDEKLVKEKLGVEKPQDFESKAGKKSVLNRMASGNSSVIKKAIAKYSLDYEIENQKEAKSKAEMFVDEVGVDNALIAVRKGLIDGAQGAFIYARAIEILEQEINSLKGDDKLDAIADYQELLGQISDELDNRSRSNGRFIAALAEIYNSSNGRYNLKKMVNDYKAQNNGTISKEVLEKLKNVEEKLKESEAKLADLEAKKRIEEENEAFNNILESVARKKRINTNAKISDKQKAKAFADKLRSFKISNNANLSAATPFSIAYDLAIETAAKAIEVSGLVSDAIKAGVNSIRNSKLSKDEKEQALSDLFDLFDDSDVNTGQKGMMSISEEGVLRIPHSLIREKVENGVDNIDDLVSELMSDAQELFPDLDFTERQVRDIVTGYGKVSNPTTDEIETQISIMKSLGKIASGLEDAYKGQRPLRSGQQRREPTVKERTEMKKLKALLRDLPLADADIKKAYKTALEAIKKRLSNEIEELDEQIANGEKRKGQKSVIEYDQEAKDLKAVRDAKKALLDEMVGKPELTEQQKIDRAEKTLQKRLDDLQQKIDNSEIDYAKKAESVTSAKLEEMRKLKKELESQIQKMREDSGLAEERLIEIAKRNASKRLATLKERIANGDFEKRKRKPTPTDVELNKIKSEIAQQKEIFDKEVYKLELKNRRIEQKALDVLKDILSIPKILSFTADLSFVGIQNVTQIYKMGANSLINLAKTGKLKGTFRDAMAKTFKAMASPDFEQKFMQTVKANPNYQLWKDSKLGIVESHYKESAKAEVFQHNALSTLFDILGNYVASKGYEKAGDIIKNYVNIISIFERGQTVFENQMRINRFQEGVDLLKAQGLNPIDDIQEYRKVAAAVNTLTGRANTGSKVASALREANGTLFSSFSNWAAGVNQLNPYWYYTLTPTARKMALTDVAHHIIGAGSMISMAALYALGQDDDDEDKVTIETDPTSSDFAVIKIGNLRIDPWAGKKTTVVAFARLRYAEKKDKYGNFKKYGIEYEDEDWIDLPLEYAGNKIAPGPRFAIDRFFKTKKVEYKGQTFREDKYGVDFKESKYLIPLIFENFREVNEEQPNLFGKATMALSWTGLINTNVYGGMKEGFKDMPDDLIEKEYKVKIQKIKDNEKILDSAIEKMTKDYVEKKISKNEIMRKVDSLVNGDAELFSKKIESIVSKINKEELKTLVNDPFYLGLKKEENPKIQAILYYSKFKDDSGMSYKEKKERDRNLRYIEFDAENQKFKDALQELKNSKKKPIN